MPKISIDQREVEVPPGATILAAARKLGIDIPTLCFFDDFKPATSCLVCLVKLRDPDRLVPSCATLAADGMVVESETPEVHDIRKTVLELLLSDHVGDCLGPCHFACPAHMDIPVMLRQIGDGRMSEAIETIKRDIALPAILGRICPKPCEKLCRRHGADGPVAVCQLKRFAADADMASTSPFSPLCEEPSGRHVAIVGAGPAGLSAAYALRQQGHAVTVLDDRAQPGGRLYDETTAAELPRDVLQKEIGLILKLDVQLKSNTRVGEQPRLADLREQFDAVLVACGAMDQETIERWGLTAAPRGIKVDKRTYETGLPGVFAAGNALRGKGLVVRSVADGKEAAVSIDQFLHGQPVTGPKKPFSVRMRKIDEEEMTVFLAGAGDAPREEPKIAEISEYTSDDAQEQSDRCLHCDCRAVHTCTLRRYSDAYGADPDRFRGTRRKFVQKLQPGGVIYEPGKCIDCGLCVEIVKAAGEPLGLTFIGRGFDVRVGVPFDRSMEEALGATAARCVALCPTAALAFRENSPASELPILPPQSHQ